MFIATALERGKMNDNVIVVSMLGGAGSNGITTPCIS
jgi:hypothetical protein